MVANMSGWKYLFKKGNDIIFSLYPIQLDTPWGQGMYLMHLSVSSIVLGPEGKNSKRLLNHEEMIFNFLIFPPI